MRDRQANDQSSSHVSREENQRTPSCYMQQYYVERYSSVHVQYGSEVEGMPCKREEKVADGDWEIRPQSRTDHIVLHRWHAEHGNT